MTEPSWYVHSNALMDEPFEDDDGQCQEVVLAPEVDEIRREREVFRQALADIYTGRLEDGPLYDDGQVVEAINRRAHRALFVDTESPPGGYPA